MDIEILEQIGLTKSEINVYLALLELGSSSTGKIVDKSGAPSSKIYEILDRLIKKGLASFVVKSGVKYFEAASPARIMDYMEEKEKSMQEQKEKLRKIIPELELQKKLAGYSSEAAIYKGIRGLESAFYPIIEQLQKNDELLMIGLPKRSKPFDIFLIKFFRKCIERKIKIKIVAEYQSKKDLNYLHENKIIFDIRFNADSSPAQIFIIKDISIILSSEAKEPLAMMINSREISESFRNEFRRLWDQEAKIVKGIAAMQNLFEDIIANGGVDWIGARGYTVDAIPAYIDEWEKRAVKKGIVTRNIVDPEIKGHRITKFSFAQTKYTLAKEFSSMSCFWIYKNKVAISNWTAKEPIALIIENKSICEMYKKQFESLWNKDKKIMA